MRLKLLSLIVFCCALSVGAVTPALVGHAQAQEEAASPSPTPPLLPSPKPTAEDPKIHKLAVQQFLAWQEGVIDRDLYTEDLVAQLTDSVVNEATQSLAHLGGLQQAQFRGISQAKGQAVYVYHMTCEHGAIDMDFALQPDGKIALMFFE